MNNINPIFEALSYVDDRHISAERKKSIPKKLRITLIAAAITATVALLAGFTAAVRGNFTLGFSDKESASHSFNLNITSQEFTIPEEYKPQDGTPVFMGKADMPPRELFEKFGITPPINDNFIDGEKPVDIQVTEYSDDDAEIDFEYEMYDKNIAENVRFKLKYISNIENNTYNMNHGLLPGEPSEVITLNNGSLCLVTAWRTVFSINGAYCEIKLPYDFDLPDNYDEMSEDEQRQIIAEEIKAMPGIETVKQVLKDLAVIDS